MQRPQSLYDLHDPRDWCKWCGARLPDDEHWGQRKYCCQHCEEEREFRLQGLTADDVKARRRCAMCGGPIPWERSLRARFCGKSCRNKASHQERDEASAAARAARSCVMCGASLAHRNTKALYCGRKCQSAADRAALKARKAREG